jgi:hypothetical protein
MTTPTTTTSVPDLAMALALLTTTYRDNVSRWNGGLLGLNRLLDNKRFPSVFRRLALKCHPDRNKSTMANAIFKALNTVSTAHADVPNLSLEWNGLFSLYRNTRFQLLRDHHSVMNRARFEALLIHKDDEFHPELREGQEDGGLAALYAHIFPPPPEPLPLNIMSPDEEATWAYIRSQPDLSLVTPHHRVTLHFQRVRHHTRTFLEMMKGMTLGECVRHYARHALRLLQMPQTTRRINHSQVAFWFAYHMGRSARRTGSAPYLRFEAPAVEAEAEA